MKEYMYHLDSIQRSNLCTNCHLAVAECICDTCKNEKLCSECYQTEHTSCIMQKHQKLSNDKKLPEMVPCSTHKDEKLKFWCRSCNILVCRDCLLLEHRDHTYASINDVAKEVETKVSISCFSQNIILRYFHC